MASHAAALRGVALLRAMLARGYLGSDPETIGMVLDVCEFVGSVKGCEVADAGQHAHTAECRVSGVVARNGDAARKVQ